MDTSGCKQNIDWNLLQEELVRFARARYDLARELAEDLAAEAILATYRSRCTIDDHRAYAYQALKNQIRSTWSKEKRRRELAVRRPPVGEPTALDIIEDTLELFLAMGLEHCYEIARALLQGFSHAEIAEQRGLTDVAQRKQWSRCLSAVRGELLDEG